MVVLWQWTSYLTTDCLWQVGRSDYLVNQCHQVQIEVYLEFYGFQDMNSIQIHTEMLYKGFRYKTVNFLQNIRVAIWRASYETKPSYDSLHAVHWIFSRPNP